jgi:hypothetical protein
MLSCFAGGGVPGEEGAGERGFSGAEVAGEIFIRLPSEGCGVCVVDAGPLCGSDCFCADKGDRVGDGLEAFADESAAPSVVEEGAGFESLARRLLRIWHTRDISSAAAE